MTSSYQQHSEYYRDNVGKDMLESKAKKKDKSIKC